MSFERFKELSARAEKGALVQSDWKKKLASLGLEDSDLYLIEAAGGSTVSFLAGMMLVMYASED